MFSNGFPKEWSTLRKLAWLYRTVINAVVSVLKTVIGNPIHITDALAKPVQALSVAIEPIQDLHGYDAPWPAGGGVNKLIECVPGTYTGTYCQAVVSADGTITVSGTTGGSSDTINIPLKAKITTPSEQFYVHMFNTLNADIAPSFELSTDIAGTTINAACSPANRIYTVSTNRLGVEIDRVRFWIGANKNAAVTLHPMFALTNSVVPWTPYSNLCPISGWTGANVTRTGKNLLPNISGARSEGSIFIGQADGTTFPTHLKAGVTYAISFTTNISQAFVYMRENGGSNILFGISGSTYTPASDMDVQMWVYNSGLTSVSNFQLEIGSTASDYEAYTGTTYHIPLGTTVYGGTLDVTTGKLTVTKAYALLNDPTGWRASTGTVDFTYYAGEFTNRKKYDNSYDGLVCSYMVVNSEGKNTLTARWTSSTSDIFGLRWVDGSLDQVKADASAGKIAICYELATPIVYDLTPTEVSALLGTNNIWSDSNGDLTLTYLADGNASDVEALNILLGGRYVNNHGENEPTDREALDILLGGTR